MHIFCMGHQRHVFLFATFAHWVQHFTLEHAACVYARKPFVLRYFWRLWWPEWKRLETVFLPICLGITCLGSLWEPCLAYMREAHVIFDTFEASGTLSGHAWKHVLLVCLEITCVATLRTTVCSNAWTLIVSRYFSSLWYLEWMCLETVFSLYAWKYNFEGTFNPYAQTLWFYATLKASGSSSGRVWKVCVGCIPGNHMVWQDLKAMFTLYAWTPHVLQNIWSLW